MAEPKRGSLDYLLRRAFDNGVIARAKVMAQQVPSHREREFLEHEYAEFRRSLMPDQEEVNLLPGMELRPPAPQCPLEGCTYPNPHRHGTD